MNPALYQNQAEFSILIFSVPLKVLSDSNCFLNQMVQILREIRSKAFGLKDSQDFISRHKTDLCHAMWVPQDHTYLGGSQAFLGQLVNLFLHVVRRQLQPRGHATAVGQRRLAEEESECSLDMARNALFALEKMFSQKCWCMPEILVHGQQRQGDF